MDNIITVSAVVFRDEVGRVLTVRKRDTEKFMFPGGKPELGEDALSAALREVSEEIGVVLAPDQLELLGNFQASAANEVGFDIAATVFTCAARITPQPAAEIEQIAWVNPTRPEQPLAPLLRDHVFPLLD